MTYEQHPLSAAFPPMLDAEYVLLKNDIEVNGVLNHVTMYDGMVLDGWHRYRAATELGQDCPTVELPEHVEPRDFVIAQNRHRRHITQAQLAMAAAKVYEWMPAHRPTKEAGTQCPLTKTNDQLAGIAGVGARTIKQAKTVQREAVPEVVKAVESGAMGLTKAAAIAKLPKEEQAAAIEKPMPKPPETPPEDDYTELDAAHDQIAGLQAELVVARMASTDTQEQQQAAQLIEQLQAEIKTLTATLRATEQSRDFYMSENAQLKKQCAAQRREIDKIKK